MLSAADAPNKRHRDATGLRLSAAGMATVEVHRARDDHGG